MWLVESCFGPRRGEPARLHPRRRTAVLTFVPFSLPCFPHRLYRDTARRFWPGDCGPPFLQRGLQHSASDQALLVVRLVAWRAKNDSGHRPVAVADENLFAAAYHPNVGAEPGFQITNVDPAHGAIIQNMTILVRLADSSGPSAEEAN